MEKIGKANSNLTRRNFFTRSALSLATVPLLNRREQDMRKIFDAYLTARESRDVEKMQTFFTDDCVYEDETFQFAIRGKQALRAMFQTSFAGFPDSHIEIRNFFSTGEWICVQWTMSGTHTGVVLGVGGSGKKVIVKGASVIRMEGDKIKHHTDYLDRYTLEKQIGIRT